MSALRKLIDNAYTTGTRNEKARALLAATELDKLEAENKALKAQLTEAEDALRTAWNLHPNIPALYRYFAKHFSEEEK